MSKDNTYNGWTNYETWRVMLEIFDGYETDEEVDDDYVKDYTEELVLLDVDENSLAASYALSFVSNVHWYQIAEAVNEYNKERKEE
tara:strand:- start:210 stop:467 length:258 start_codon:yes stop_codon:yes gene_type:complete